MQPGVLRNHTNLINIISRLFDLVVLFGSAYLAYAFVFGFGHPFPNHYLLAIFCGIIIAFASFNILGIYSPARGKNIANYIFTIGMAWLATMLLLALIAFLTKTSTKFSRIWFVEWMAIGCFMSCLSRSTVLLLLRHIRKKGFNIRRVIIIGTGVMSDQIIKKLTDSQWSGYRVVHTIDVLSDTSLLKQNSTNKNDSYEVNNLINTHAVDEVWIALPFKELYRLEVIMEALKFSTINIKLIPDIMGLDLINHSVYSIAGVPVMNLRASPMEGINIYIKALEDKVIASFILLLISPLMLIISILVKLSSRGPIFYKQERVSWNNKNFMILKFRSMPINVENTTGAKWAKPGENRATKIGAFLRKTSLDELPQFLNVLKGDMSIVGPRPERPVFVDEFKNQIPKYMQKHMVKAGITGWAQINGWRGSSDLTKRIEYDIYYIEHWSLWFDIKIIFLTLFKGWINKNAY